MVTDVNEINFQTIKRNDLGKEGDKLKFTFEKPKVNFIFRKRLVSQLFKGAFVRALKFTLTLFPPSKPCNLNDVDKR